MSGEVWAAVRDADRLAHRTPQAELHATDGVAARDRAALARERRLATRRECSRPGCGRRAAASLDGLCLAHRRAEGMANRPAAPLVEKVRRMVAAGWTVHAIADAAGLHPHTLSRLHRGIGTSVRTDTWERVMGVDESALKPGWRPPHGTRRRLQALAAAGWRHHELSTLLDVDRVTVRRLLSGNTGQVRSSVDDRVRAVYAVLEALPVRPRSRYADPSWPLPAQWDPGTIDDLEAGPVEHPEVVDVDGTFDPVRVRRATAVYREFLDSTPRRRPSKAEQPELTTEERRRVARALSRDYATSAVATVMRSSMPVVERWAA